MDPWIASQPSLSLDLHVGLPSLGRHQAPPVLVKPKKLVEETFLPLKKDPEVHTHSALLLHPWMSYKLSLETR